MKFQRLYESKYLMDNYLQEKIDIVLNSNDPIEIEMDKNQQCISKENDLE